MPNHCRTIIQKPLVYAFIHTLVRNFTMHECRLLKIASGHLKNGHLTQNTSEIAVASKLIRWVIRDFVCSEFFHCFFFLLI